MPPRRLPREPRLDAANRLQPDLSMWLHKALSPPARELLAWIVAQAAGKPLYLVGGFVRDLFLNRPSLDLDLVLEGDAIAWGRYLVKQHGGSLQAHTAFKTAVWTLPASAASRGVLPAHIDLISAREETYPRPGALPQVQLADLAADQARRDFTINTLALSLNGTPGRLHDPHGGLADLRSGLVRTLHPDSFRDDPTRMLRAYRFAGRLGFRLAPPTQRELKEHKFALSSVSGERIFHELELALEEKQRVHILQQLQRAGLLAATHPALKLPARAVAVLQTRRKLPQYWDVPADQQPGLAWVQWLMWLPVEAVAGVAERLRFDGELRQVCVAAAGLRQQRTRLARLKPSALVAHLQHVPLAAVAALWSAAEPPLAAQLARYGQRLRRVQPRSDGYTLRRRGLAPGPVYAQLLWRLRAAWLDGEVRTAKGEERLLESLLREAER